MLAERHRDVYLSAQETQALVHALDREPDRDAAAALMLLLLTGARKSEVLNARWEHVDLHRSLLTVPRSKSGRTRHIPLSPLAVQVIVHQHQRHRPGGDGGWVFPGKGVGKAREDLRGPWKRAKVAAGLLPDTRIHDLRHSFASALANEGVPLNEIGVILGHSQLATTARYAHHAPQRLVETATVAARAWKLVEGPGVE
ncbi:tyrosine-type recombinase/integrase [Caenispirillum bisanense]|uniref:Phage integrase family protein n=1 Tax=Caenispirillum bisanense TaxID=414052 RepID=A0A286GJ31_9PROT|nr:site-specific integrase [Caenispirillum bisanense]SOD95510.1 Phage integrase family protein [Caenispirillum bisanense]